MNWLMRCRAGQISGNEEKSSYSNQRDSRLKSETKTTKRTTKSNGMKLNHTSGCSLKFENDSDSFNGTKNTYHQKSLSGGLRSTNKVQQNHQIAQVGCKVKRCEDIENRDKKRRRKRTSRRQVRPADGGSKFYRRCSRNENCFTSFGPSLREITQTKIDDRRPISKGNHRFQHSIPLSVAISLPLQLVCFVIQIAQANTLDTGISSSLHHSSNTSEGWKNLKNFNGLALCDNLAIDGINCRGNQPGPARNSISSVEDNNNNNNNNSEPSKEAQVLRPTTKELGQKLMVVNTMMTSDISREMETMDGGGERPGEDQLARRFKGPTKLSSRRGEIEEASSHDELATVNETPTQVTDDKEALSEIATGNNNHDNDGGQDGDELEGEEDAEVSRDEAPLLKDGSSIIVNVPGDSDSNDDYNDYGTYVIYDTGHSNSSSATSANNNNISNNNDNLPTNTPAVESMASSSKSPSTQSSSSFQVIFFAAIPPYKLTSTQSPSVLSSNSLSPPLMSMGLHQVRQLDGRSRPKEAPARVANDSFRIESKAASAAAVTLETNSRPMQASLPMVNWSTNMDGGDQLSSSRGLTNQQEQPPPFRRHRARRHRSKQPSATITGELGTHGGQYSRAIIDEKHADSETPDELDEDDVEWLRNMKARGLSFGREQAGERKLDDSKDVSLLRRFKKPQDTIKISSPPSLFDLNAEPNQIFNQEDSKQANVDNASLMGSANGSTTDPNALPTSSTEMMVLANNVNNGSSHLTLGWDNEEPQQQHTVFYWRLIWFILPIGATFGNLLVIMAVYRERSLQSVTNYFIVSLAAADLFVGLIVMPFAVYVLVNGVWELSDTICDIYVAVDVTSSTASILNLVAISIDRYRAVAYPIAYTAGSSSTIAQLTICGVWLISCGVGAPIIFGLNTTPGRKSSLCILYNSTYIFWSSLVSFFIPCIAMIALYWRIFSAIRSRTKKAIQAGGGMAGGGANNKTAASANPTIAAAASALTVAKVAQPNGNNKRLIMIKVLNKDNENRLKPDRELVADVGNLINNNNDNDKEIILSASAVAAATTNAPDAAGVDIAPSNCFHKETKADNTSYQNHQKISQGPSATSETSGIGRQSIVTDATTSSQLRIDSRPEVEASQDQRPSDRSSGPCNWSKGDVCPMNLVQPLELGVANGLDIGRFLMETTKSSRSDGNLSDKDYGNQTTKSPDNGLSKLESLRLALLQVRWCRCSHEQFDQSSVEISVSSECQSRFLSRLVQCSEIRAHSTAGSLKAPDVEDDNEFAGACLALLLQSARHHEGSSFNAVTPPQPDSYQHSRDNGEQSATTLVKLLQRATTNQIFINTQLYSSQRASEIAKPETPSGPKIQLERLYVHGIIQSTASDSWLHQPRVRTKVIPLSDSDTKSLRSSIELHWRLCNELIVTAECTQRPKHQKASDNDEGYLSIGSSKCCCCAQPIEAVEEAPPKFRAPLSLSLIEPYTGSCTQLNRATVLELNVASQVIGLFETLVARWPGQSGSSSALILTWSIKSITPPKEYRRIRFLDKQQPQTDGFESNRIGSQICAKCRAKCLLASVAQVMIPTSSQKEDSDLPSGTNPVLLATRVEQDSAAYCSKLPSNRQQTIQTQIIRLDPEFECRHLSRLLKKEQCQLKQAIHKDPEIGETGSESSASFEDDEGSRSDSSSRSSGSTNFRLGSSSGSSITGLDCSTRNEYDEVNFCSRRSCCQPLPACTACEANSVANSTIGAEAPSGARQHNPSPAISGTITRSCVQFNGERPSSTNGHCDCVTPTTSESVACRQLAPCVVLNGSRRSLQDPHQPIDESRLPPDSCNEKHLPATNNISATKRDFAGVKDTSRHTQSFSVLQNATEQIKRRSMRLSQLIRGTRGFRSSTKQKSPMTTESDHQNNTPGEDQSSSCSAAPGPTNVFNSKSLLSTAEVIQKNGLELVRSDVVEQVPEQSLMPIDADNCKEKTSINHSVNFTTDSRSFGKSNWTPTSDVPTVDSSSSNNSNQNKSSGTNKYPNLVVSKLINTAQSFQSQISAADAADRKHGNGPIRISKGKKDDAALGQVSRHRVGGSRRRREKNAAKRERKATKTLAIVLGIFLVCWTPFFTCNIIDGICIQLDMDCRPGMMIYLVTSWLGYINSCVNPIIYTIFNMEFRRAFKKILTTRPKCCSDN